MTRGEGDEDIEGEGGSENFKTPLKGGSEKLLG